MFFAVKEDHHFENNQTNYLRIHMLLPSCQQLTAAASQS